MYPSWIEHFPPTVSCKVADLQGCPILSQSAISDEAWLLTPNLFNSFPQFLGYIWKQTMPKLDELEDVLVWNTLLCL